MYVCAVLYVQTGGRIRRTKQVQRDRRQVSWRCLGRIGSLQKLNQTEPRNKKIVELPPNFVTFGGAVKWLGVFSRDRGLAWLHTSRISKRNETSLDGRAFWKVALRNASSLIWWNFLENVGQKKKWIVRKLWARSAERVLFHKNRFYWKLLLIPIWFSNLAKTRFWIWECHNFQVSASAKCFASAKCMCQILTDYAWFFHFMSTLNNFFFQMNEFN